MSRVRRGKSVQVRRTKYHNPITISIMVDSDDDVRILSEGVDMAMTKADAVKLLAALAEVFA